MINKLHLHHYHITVAYIRQLVCNKRQLIDHMISDKIFHLIIICFKLRIKSKNEKNDDYVLCDRGVCV